MKRVYVLMGLMAVAPAFAAEPAVEAPVLLPEAQAKRYLVTDPAFQGAGNAFAAARDEARQTAASPYEWNATYTRQERDYGVGPKSKEWNIGVERTFRLPGKRRADEADAAAGEVAAAAQWRLARREAAETLLNLWLDWLEARSSKTLLAEQREAVAQSLAAVELRVKSGDAAPLEQRLAGAELADVERQASEAATAEATAWARLTARYGVTGEEAPALPEPLPVPFDGAWWQVRLHEHSDRLALALAERERAQAGAERAKAERLPDPTIGAYTGREAYGEEKLVGLSISLPIPGERRSLEVSRQLALANAAKDAAALAERETEAEARAAHAAALGHYERWRLARSAAATLTDNARLVQKAYALGEQDLQALLLARRQALGAAEAEVRARTDALRAYYRLLLDGKLLWPDWLYRQDGGTAE